MQQPTTTNNFLTQLLAIQQDGQGAISAPQNWSSPPVLEVTTVLDPIIDELLDAILGSLRRRLIARWHFFIGSPGNGKSSLVGKLYRTLATKDWVMEDDNGVALCDLAKSSTHTLPYLMRIRHRTTRYPVAYIVQDASVSRNPYASNSSPTQDLLKTIQDAWDRGICLIVCTNRGILESAIRQNYLDPDTNKTRWFQLIRDLAEAPTSVYKLIDESYEFENRKNSVFRTLVASYSHLDNQSLLLNCDTFEDMIKMAVDESRWKVCETCRVNGQCPYRANQEWLKQDRPRGLVVRLLLRAEVISGQVLVLREANALIALIFAGCTRDYRNQHPCEWVHRCVDTKDYFSLASRRVYMVLLCSWAPHGLEPSSGLRNRQLRALTGLYEVLSQDNRDDRTGTVEALRHVVDQNSPSTDVGVHRLLGLSGSFSVIDPILDMVPSSFFDICDTDLGAFPLRSGSGALFTRIEQSCIDVWLSLYEALEHHPEYLAEAQWTIKRWSSMFLVRFATMEQGLSSNAHDLDKFIDLLRIQIKPDQNSAERKHIREGSRDIRTLIESVASDGAVQLSESVWLQGEWIRNHFGAKLTQTSTERGASNIALSLQFGDKDAQLSAETYLCLKRLAYEGLHRLCAPEVLLQGVKAARIDAVATSNYSFIQDGIEMTVNHPDEGQFFLTRTGDDVDVE